ncbi:MAG TPA: phosphodiesterase [Bacteroidota bacterium]|nr:phosphodiesterase [Bacteroidota bacterium]
MKMMFLSDIHGSIFWLKQAMDQFEHEDADQLILLGDLLYHGPRNPLPEHYDTQAVAALLNRYKQKIIAVRGNCDAEVDQFMFEFPMMADYSVLLHEGRKIFLTHGHIFDVDHLPNVSAGDVFVQGHTHIPVAEKRGDIFFFNPGSLALPKNNHPHSYGILKNHELQIKDLDGTVITSLALH